MSDNLRRSRAIHKALTQCYLREPILSSVSRLRKAVPRLAAQRFRRRRGAQQER